VCVCVCVCVFACSLLYLGNLHETLIGLRAGLHLTGFLWA